MIFINSFPPGTAKGNRLIRMVDHLIQNRSFYPLFPPPENTGIDFKQFEHFSFPGLTPDVLITPTKLNHFADNVRGVLCINPGTLVSVVWRFYVEFITNLKILI